MREAPRTTNLRGFTSHIERQFNMSDNDFTLTQDFLRSIVTYDSESGQFYWRKTGLPAVGKCSQGYIRLKIKGKTYKAHRLAFIYEFGKCDCLMIDHINGVKHDNRISNLRGINNSGNQLNRWKSNIDNTVGFLGVNFNKLAGKYAARLQINGKRMHLGYFLSPEDASKAYNLAKSEMTNSINFKELT